MNVMQTQNTGALIEAIVGKKMWSSDPERGFTTYTKEEHEFILDLLQQKKEQKENEYPHKVADEMLTAFRSTPNNITTQLDEENVISFNTGYFHGFSDGYKYAACAYVRSQHTAKDKEKDELLRDMAEVIEDMRSVWDKSMFKTPKTIADTLTRYRALTNSNTSTE